MQQTLLIDLLRIRRGLKWAIPTALVLVSASFYAAKLIATLFDRGAPGWLNLLVWCCAGTRSSSP